MRCKFCTDDKATHRVSIARTDVRGQDEVVYLCTNCTGTYVTGNIEVSNGPQVILTTRLSR